jgi:hypothetical protein
MKINRDRCTLRGARRLGAQKAPGVAIGDDAVSGLLGYVPVDVIWLSAERSGGRVRALLLHRTYYFDGPCLEES